VTEPIDHPAHETAADKPDAAGAQAAADATFNAAPDGDDDVETTLRQRLADAGVAADDAWIEDTARRIRAGQPVVVGVDEEPPGR
jgi:hypothetical protein